MTTVGFVGLGNMGGPMARNLINAGHSLKVYDLDEDKVNMLVQAGAARAESVADAAGGAEMVVTMVPEGRHVREVFLGEEGIIAAVDAGTLMIDCSTIDVATAQAVHEAAAAAGFEMVDAPVSGGTFGAEAATLTFMCGGSAQAVAKATALLEGMGKNIVHCGGPGLGQAAKICNNMCAAINTIGVSEAFVLAEVDTEEGVLALICKLAQKLYSDNQKATDPKDKVDFQILSPRHAGTVGVTRLNERLRELLNPRTPGLAEVRLGNDTMREDDRVMVVQNDYTLKVFNGDVGKISRVDRKGKNVEVKVFGETPLFVPIEFKKAGKLIRLAYACTVHKAQGLEYDYILMPVVDSFRHQLQRNLLYTAVTRAKVKVILVGTRTALSQAVANAKEDERNTLFLDRLASGGLTPPPAG